ncbi:MAG TPA: CocE/NonD family hydrolase [Blastocatellia bacterium]|nr:CocE/NonD family hydrolase [Blastocatellia bacterium]
MISRLLSTRIPKLHLKTAQESNRCLLRAPFSFSLRPLCVLCPAVRALLQLRNSVSVILLGCTIAGAQQTPFNARDQKADFATLQDSSLYLPMKDGVKIAIEVMLPDPLPAGRKLPTIMKITRYGRAPADGSIPGLEKFWVQHGFVSVIVDERGTGASFGNVRYGKATLGDVREIVDWIVKQPWSNGRVGAIGASYEGTTAELLAAIGHPAVRAVAPFFSDYNYYTDLIRPGGVFNERLIKTWQDEVAEMDAGAAARPVNGDVDRSLLKQALEQHRSNPNVYEDAKKAEFIDDFVTSFRDSYIGGSIPGVQSALERSHVPMLIFASWFDAGTVQGTLKRFQTFQNSQRIYIGAWNHGGSANANPFVPAGTPPDPAQFQAYLLALDFFNHYLNGLPENAPPERRLWYYTIGENHWHSTTVWPPAGTHKAIYHLGPESSLSDKREAPVGEVAIEMPLAATGDLNRWMSQATGGEIRYDKVLSQLQQLPAFTSKPLPAALEITGQTVLRLRLSCSAPDPEVFAYLMAIDPQGKPIYLTEGQLRLIDRKPSAQEQTLHTYLRGDREEVPKGEQIEADMTLFPISALIPAGYSLRLVLAANDESVFALSEPYKARISGASELELPVREH